MRPINTLSILLMRCLWFMLPSFVLTPDTASSRDFPGFQQVGDTGEAAQLYFSSGDISRNGSQYVVHVIKSFAGDYATFDVITNCRSSTQRLTGTMYHADGTSMHIYQGNATAVIAGYEPGMDELMQKSCAAAMAARKIPGEFNIPAAMELLYGPYNQAFRASIWPDANIPSDMEGLSNLSTSAKPDQHMVVQGVA